MKFKIFIIAVMALSLYSTVLSAQTDTAFFIDGSMGRIAVRMQLPELSAGEKRHMVVICHGFTGCMDEPLLEGVADNLVEAGIGAVRFDFNGHGRSEGDFQQMTVLNEIEDAMAVIAYVRNLPQTLDVSLAGHSQGGVVSAMTAGQLGGNVVRSVVLMAPAAVLRDDALRGNTMGAVYDPWHAPEYVELPTGHRLGRGYIETALTLPIYETAARYDGPAIVIHGMADRIVPYTYGERFCREMPSCEIVLVPGDDHMFTANVAYAASVASDWIVRTLLAD